MWPATHPTGTLGIEEELQLVDPITHELVPHAKHVLESPMQCELFTCMVETTVEPTPDLDALHTRIQASREHVHKRAKKAGVQAASSGTHAFSKWQDQTVTAEERYEKIIDQYGEAALQNVIFGLHIHVAINDKAQAVQVYRALSNFSPVLLALSANSPYWQGEDSGFASIRAQLFKHLPNTGLGPAFNNWKHYRQHVDQMVAQETIKNDSYLWWDVRLHPKYGTVEVRVFDAQTHAEQTTALAALVQSIALETIQGNYSSSYDQLDTERLREIASRDGLHDPQIKMIAEQLISNVKHIPSQNILYTMCEKPGYARQRKHQSPQLAQAEVIVLTD